MPKTEPSNCWQMWYRYLPWQQQVAKCEIHAMTCSGCKQHILQVVPHSAAFENAITKGVHPACAGLCHFATRLLHSAHPSTCAGLCMPEVLSSAKSYARHLLSLLSRKLEAAADCTLTDAAPHEHTEPHHKTLSPCLREFYAEASTHSYSVSHR